MHLWVGRCSSREDISGASQPSETAVISPLLLTSHDTQMLTMGGSGLHHASSDPSNPALFLKHKKWEATSSQRELRRYVRKPFIPYGGGSFAGREAWGAVGYPPLGPLKPHLDAALSNLTQVGPQPLPISIILWFPRPGFWQRTSLELTPTAHLLAGPGQSQSQAFLSREWAGSRLTPVNPMQCFYFC